MNDIIEYLNSVVHTLRRLERESELDKEHIGFSTTHIECRARTECEIAKLLFDRVKQFALSKTCIL